MWGFDEKAAQVLREMNSCSLGLRDEEVVSEEVND